MNDPHPLIMAQIERLQDTTEKIADDVSDVKERVTRLEATAANIKYLIAVLIAGTPVLFLIFDRLSN